MYNDVYHCVFSVDGVWDNWIYEDVTKFVLDKSCIQAVMESNNPNGNGAVRVSQAFMHRNMIFSKRNFGRSADNATGILLYISPSHDFPI